MYWRAYQDSRAKKRRSSLQGMTVSMQFLKGKLKTTFREVSPVIIDNKDKGDISEEVINQLNQKGRINFRKRFVIIIGLNDSEIFKDEIGSHDIREIVKKGIGYVYLTDGSFFRINIENDRNISYRF